MRSHKSTPPMFLLYSATTAGRGTVTWRFSFVDHLMQLSWGSISWTVEAIKTALLFCHFVTATSDGFLTIISDIPLGFLLFRLVSSDIFDLHGAGIRFFIMVPVPRRPFVFKLSSSLMEVKYLSKYRCVPVGRDCANLETAFPLIPSCWTVFRQYTFNDSCPCTLQNPVPDHWDWQGQILSVLWGLVFQAQTVVQDTGL